MTGLGYSYASYGSAYVTKELLADIVIWTGCVRRRGVLVVDAACSCPPSVERHMTR